MRMRLLVLSVFMVSACSLSAPGSDLSPDGGDKDVSIPAGKRVVVIGAGISGLMAADALKRQGADVTVLEAQGAVGGRISSISTNTWDARCDVGAQFINDGYSTLIPLISELGLSGMLTRLGTNTATIRGGQPITIDSADPLTIYTRGLLGFVEAGVVRAAYDATVPELRGLPLFDYSAWRKYDDEVASTWTLSSYGVDGSNYLADPSVQSLFFQPLPLISRAKFFWIMSNLDRGGAWYTMLGSTQVIAEVLARRLTDSGAKIQLNAEVLSVAPLASGQIEIRLLDGTTLMADGAIVTTPAPIAKRILPAPTVEQAAVLETNYSATIVVDVVVDSPDPDLHRQGKIFGVYVPQVEAPAGKIASFSIETGKSDLAHAGHELYGLHLRDSAAQAYLAASASDGMIVDEITKEAEAYVPNIRSGKLGAVVQRWNHAIPYSKVGRAQLLQSLWTSQANGAERILLAGDLTTFATMDAAAWSGGHAAHLLAPKLR